MKGLRTFVHAVWMVCLSATASAIPPRASAPAVGVQVVGVRAGPYRAWGAVTHAITRDAGASLLRCSDAHPRARATVTVSLAPDERGRWQASAATAEESVGRCVAQAAARIAVPPAEATPGPEDTPDGVEFTVLFHQAAQPRAVVLLPADAP